MFAKYTNFFFRICGWKQKEHPMLYNALHIGDRLINIEGITVKSAADAHRILQSHYCGLYVSIIIIFFYKF